MNEMLAGIRTELENTYDIPFGVREEDANGEPCFIMGPENEGQEFFTIRVSFRNRIRMTAEFIPEKYGAEFVRSMAGRSAEQREIFLRFLSLMQDKGARVSITIDGHPVDPEQFRSYAGRWNSFSARATKVPVTDSGTFSYSDVALEWGALMTGMVLSLANIEPVEDGDEESIPAGQAEGSAVREIHTRYERSRINRKLCLERLGYCCCICGFDFERTYGEIGHHFIHVHHVKPVSQLGAGYIINPETDLIPVCPNCHAMLHRKDPPYFPEELRHILTG